MPSGYLLLLGLTAWYFLLLMLMGAMRISLVLRKKHNLRFLVGGEDVSPFAQRLSRAHANCLENLPFVIALVVVATGTSQLNVLEGLSLVFLLLRVAQTITHLCSTGSYAILLRFLFFSLQCAILIYWFFLLVL